MSNHVKTLAVAVLSCAALALMANGAAANPGFNALALKNAAPSTVETVRWAGGWHGGGWHGGGWHRGGWGWGWGGFAAGAVVGSALASPYYYGYGPYYPYYPPPYYAPPPGNAVAYCAQRFRSYDPRTGTYLGLDGLRHPCP